MSNVNNAFDISKLLCIPRIDEQGEGSVLKYSQNGTLIGMSRAYSMPFFFNPDPLVNPHIFITGITGSGKTYLTKNLMLKLYAILGCIVIVIDFTGEYSEFAGLFSAEPANPSEVGTRIKEDRNRIIYINLKGMSEKERITSAISILKTVTREMRLRGTEEKNRRVFVILDEAWKLIEQSKPLETMIREGRKYRIGVILASQLIGDVSMPFLSNIATLFVFRVQDKDSLEILQKNYNLRDDQVSQIQNLELGSCFVIQVNKSNSRDAFCVERVIGIDASSLVKIFVGDKMNVEISTSKFETLIRQVCSSEKTREIVARTKEKGSVKLDFLIKELIDNGGDRRTILTVLKKAGIREADLADAFAVAVCTMDE